MKRLILASLAGGVVLFVWGMLAWTVLPHHTMTMRPLPKEDSVVATLQRCITTEGMYYFPGMMEGMDAPSQGTNTEEAWRQRHMQGPIGMILYIPTGRDPMMAGQFIWGFVIFVLAAFIASWLLSRSTAVAGSYWQRVSFCGILGIFLAVADHLVAMNWLYFPADYTAAMVADAVVGWTLAGLAIAAVMKAP